MHKLSLYGLHSLSFQDSAKTERFKQDGYNEKKTSAYSGEKGSLRSRPHRTGIMKENPSPTRPFAFTVRRGCGIIGLAFCLSQTASPPADANTKSGGHAFSRTGNTPLVLFPGETARFPLPENHQVYVGQKSLLLLSAEDGLLTVTGKKKGQTFLRLKNKITPVYVVKRERKQQLLLLENLLKTFWGLNWSLNKESRIQITGRLYRLYDWMDLADTARKHNIPYSFYASLGDGLKAPAERFFKNLFERQNRAPPDIQWQNPPTALIPQGSQSQEAFYQKALQPFGLEPKSDPSWFAPSPVIQIETALVEISKTSFLGFGHPAPVSLQDLLNLLLSRRRGRILHHSTLSAQDGREVTIHSGGQIPFPQYNPKTGRESAGWRSHGLTLKITPKTDRQNTFRLTVRGELSQPLSGRPPSLKTQSFSGIFDLREGQVLKLLDMKKHSQGGNFTGALSLLPPGAVAEGQNYQISRVVLLRASLLKKSGGALSPSLKKKGPAAQKTSPPFQNPSLQPPKESPRKDNFFSEKPPSPPATEIGKK